MEKIIKAGTKASVYWWERYNNSNAVTLNDVYGTYSTEKERAWNYCYKEMLDNNGWGFTIISSNTFGFTCGYVIEDESGDHKLIVHTPSNKYIVY